MELNKSTMLVNLNVSQWTARKYDRKVSKEVADRYGASDEMGRYNKVLIAQDEIKKISKIVNQARTAHYENSLPWGDNGDRILPAANYARYTERLEALRADFWKAVSYFEAVYPALKDDARAGRNAGDHPLRPGYPGRDAAMKPRLIKSDPFDFLTVPRPSLGLDPWRLLVWEKLNMQSSKPEAKKL